jgi:hypothetical protein
MRCAADWVGLGSRHAAAACPVALCTGGGLENVTARSTDQLITELRAVHYIWEQSDQMAAMP